MVKTCRMTGLFRSFANEIFIGYVSILSQINLSTLSNPFFRLTVKTGIIYYINLNYFNVKEIIVFYNEN